MHRGLQGLDGIPLVVDGRSRTGQIIDFIHFHVERKRHIVPQQFKAGMIAQMLHIALGAAKIIVDAQNFGSLRQKGFAKM